ncbi:hypothetical protein [Oenococcus oeni]|uniref:hypothetical protein n=1 Tax=Oenococcus oeni TaxID=1247 RepID=UPI00050E290A|nr:hypothetical protein [Oenococcus oeni]KGH90768.1 hypothetical protein X296_00850 [Oenococcus oeni IOEB_L26_1]
MEINKSQSFNAQSKDANGSQIAYFNGSVNGSNVSLSVNPINVQGFSANRTQIEADFADFEKSVFDEAVSQDVTPAS